MWKNSVSLVEKLTNSCGKRSFTGEKVVKIGVLGVGLMGEPMALRLLAEGHQVWAYNRTATKLQPLAQAGITSTSEVLAVVQATDLLVLMLSDRTAIASVLLTESVQPALKDRTILQMGTISPEDSRALCQSFQSLGADYLEAPVLGSIPEAKSGQLIVMVGATRAQYEQWLPVLRCFGPEPLFVGPVGTAAALKLAMNQLIGSLTVAFCQSLGLIQQEHIPIDLFMQVVRQSALYAPTFDKKLDRMVNRNFAHPNFPTKHLLKDMALFVEAGQTVGLDVSPAEAVRQLAQTAVNQDLADQDYSSVFAVVAPASDESSGR
jgi:3-hydroxyisobutyrate dehydrogenase